MNHQRRKYSYSYDHQHRLTAAYYQLPGTVIPRSDSYSTSYSYDENGNISSLKRNGKEDDPNLLIEIDDLDYTYDQGNRLLKVKDATNNPAGFNMNGADTNAQYAYDDFGNLKTDPYKKISHISYNHLNLPVKITFTGGETLEYTYLADGTKLKKTAKDSGSNTTTTEYRDGFQYQNNQLEFFPHSEGYVKNTESVNGHVFNYVFTHTDHLGNIRLKYTENPQTGELTILEEDHYYPYGLTHQGYQSNHQTIGFDGQVFTLVPVTPQTTDPYKYKFNGMEWQDEFDVNVYDFGARNYDPALGRWMNMDPLAEAMRRHSPYNFAFNNPVYFIDPDGMMPTDSYGMKLSGAFESYDFTGSSSGFDVRTYDKATGKTLDFTTVSSLDNVSYDSQSGAISTNNSSAYQSFFQGVGDYAANADMSLDGGCPEPCPWGTITERPTTWVDKWEESTNILAQTSYSIVNSFSIAFQSLNPFDNQVTTLSGEGLDGTDRSLYGAEVAATFLPIGSIKGLGYSMNFRYYANAKGAGLNITKYGNRILGIDWHKFKIGGRKTGKMINRPHLDIPNRGVKHWPWHQVDKWKRGVK